MINFWEMNVSEIIDVPYSLIAALQISLFVRSVPEVDVVCGAINSRARKKPLNGGLYADDAFRGVQ